MKRIAIIVGHRESSRGAAAGGMTEWNYNRRVAALCRNTLVARGVDAVMVYRPDEIRGLSKIPGILRDIKADLAVSLHCNSVANQGVTGTETWIGRESSRLLGAALQDAMVDLFGLRSRGVRTSGAGDRARGLLDAVDWIPAALCEPGFLSNPSDRSLLRARQSDYALVLTDVLEGFAR